LKESFDIFLDVLLVGFEHVLGVNTRGIGIRFAFAIGRGWTTRIGSLREACGSQESERKARGPQRE